MSPTLDFAAGSRSRGSHALAALAFEILISYLLLFSPLMNVLQDTEHRLLERESKGEEINIQKLFKVLNKTVGRVGPLPILHTRGPVLG